MLKVVVPSFAVRIHCSEKMGATLLGKSHYFRGTSPWLQRRSKSSQPNFHPKQRLQNFYPLPFLRPVTKNSFVGMYLIISLLKSVLSQVIHCQIDNRILQPLVLLPSQLIVCKTSILGSHINPSVSLLGSDQTSKPPSS